MAEAGVGSARGYVAFISYSHKDAAMGRWLHRKLEGYRLPKRLVGTEGEDGEVPARLTPIFRDLDELPAAGDLSERVRAALAVSRNLIVLCSPNSAGSQWVAKEIATFRELHPGRPVFTAIVEGEPGQCFPSALVEGGVEPLAADLRKEGDGRRLGLLKLVAGLAGVGLDALVQRDAARRVRRVTYVTAAALMAMLGMALMTAFALNARAEAERQRADAEGLVEFMLSDVRRDLRKVGRLDIMAGVNERALSYYEGQQDRGAATATAVRARVDQTIGEDLLTRGDIGSAIPHFRAAHRTTSALIENSPKDTKIIFVHAQSEYWLGRAHELRREWPAAERHYLLFAALIDRLIATAPANPDYMAQVGWAAVDLGNIQLGGRRDAEAAQRSYEKAVQWFGRASEARPRDLRARLAQANAYGWLADSYFMRSLWRESLDARLKQYSIVKRLHQADPSSVENSYRLALAERGLSRSFAKVGDDLRARRLMHDAYHRSRSLIEHDPHNAEWLLFKAFMACELRFGKLALPADVTPERLSREVKAAAETLAGQGSPRIAEFQNCLTALN